MGLGDDAVPKGFGGGAVVIVVEHRRSALAHMPFDVVGEHAEEDVCPHHRRHPMEDRPDVEIDRLQAAKGALHVGQRLVGLDRAGVDDGVLPGG